MNDRRVRELTALYRDGLLNDTLPFWLPRCVDEEHGGFMFCLDRDGTVIDTDKGIWQQGRFTWLLATLYLTVEHREEWLRLAEHGVAFLAEHGFDDDGRMFFQVTREGQPVRKRRYAFSECFAAIAFAAYAKAAGDDVSEAKAKELFGTIIRWYTDPSFCEPKVNPEVRPSKGLVMPMIIMVTAQILRETIGLPEAREWIDRCLESIERDFMKPELKCILETAGPNGEVIDHFDGRLLNPGHAIELAWFVMHEGRLRNDQRIIQLGTTILDWMWARGWDTEYGGILYFRDLYHKPVSEYWQDMKFWWPHNETIIATLLAWKLTGDTKYAVWHQQVNDWAYSHFADPEHGEWYGYLHRDGRISTPLKGNLWKGPFHFPRQQWYCWQLLEKPGGPRYA